MLRRQSEPPAILEHASRTLDVGLRPDAELVQPRQQVQAITEKPEFGQCQHNGQIARLGGKNDRSSDEISAHHVDEVVSVLCQQSTHRTGNCPIVVQVAEAIACSDVVIQTMNDDSSRDRCLKANRRIVQRFAAKNVNGVSLRGEPLSGPRGSLLRTSTVRRREAMNREKNVQDCVRLSSNDVGESIFEAEKDHVACRAHRYRYQRGEGE